LPNIIKIDPYNSELYRFKLGAFFETQCSTVKGAFCSTIINQSILQFCAVRSKVCN